MTSAKKSYQRIIAAGLGLIAGLVIILGGVMLVSYPAKAATCDPNKDICATSDPALDTEDGKCVGVSCITKYVNPLIKLLSVTVGIAVTISIVYAGIQYSSARDDPAKIREAKHRIFNSILALLAWLFLLTFLQWLLPGGVI